MNLPLTSISPPRLRRISLLTGVSGIYALSHSWISRLALLGLPITVMDCADRFDPFAIAEEAASQDVKPDVLLETITCQKIATPLQFLGAARGILNARRGGVAVILSPLRHFLDIGESAPGRELLLDGFLSVLSELSVRSRPVLLVEAQQDAPLFHSAFDRMAALASPIWRILPDSVEVAENKKTQTTRSVDRMAQNNLEGISPDRLATG
ncbi:MAG TPA: hypothetical protein PK881_12530 [Leptospiraceae bacterium]|nr:hypothetical protein [Leptospiraceae bacterium]HNL00132.1 hypothetical protein [Leptospiraceae bacterium]